MKNAEGNSLEGTQTTAVAACLTRGTPRLATITTATTNSDCNKPHTKQGLAVAALRTTVPPESSPPAQAWARCTVVTSSSTTQNANTSVRMCREPGCIIVENTETYILDANRGRAKRREPPKVTLVTPCAGVVALSIVR